MTPAQKVDELKKRFFFYSVAENGENNKWNAL